MSWRETRNNSQDATWLTCVIKCDFLGTPTSENRQIETDVVLLPRNPYFGEKYLFKSLLICSDLIKLKDSSYFRENYCEQCATRGSFNFMYYCVLFYVDINVPDYKMWKSRIVINDTFGSV